MHDILELLGPNGHFRRRKFNHLNAALNNKQFQVHYPQGDDNIWVTGIRERKYKYVVYFGLIKRRM